MPQQGREQGGHHDARELGGRDERQILAAERENAAAQQQQHERRAERDRDRRHQSPRRDADMEHAEEGISGGEHRERDDIAHHRGQDRHILDRAERGGDHLQPAARPAVEMNLADIAHQDFVADELAHQRAEAGGGQVPQPAEDQEVERGRSEK